jgi:hypothetical protein
MRNSESPNAVLNHPNHGLPSIPLAIPFALLLNNNGRETLGVLDVHSLDVAVELLLGALLVVTSPGNADAKSVWNALDTLLPNLLVELGVETDIGGALDSTSVSCPHACTKETPGSSLSCCRFVSGG